MTDKKNRPRGKTLAPLLVFMALSLAVLTPNFFLFLGPDGHIRSDLVLPIETAVPTLLLYAAFCALIGRLYVVAWILVPFICLVPGEIYYCVQYHNPSSAQTLAVIGDTNVAEAMALARGLILPALALLLACLIVSVAIARYLTRCQLVWRGPYRWITLIALAVCVLPLIVNKSQVTTSPFEDKSHAPYTWHLDTEGISLGYPTGVPFRIASYIHQTYELKRSPDRLRQFRFHARQTVAVPGKQVFVLVIGETGRKDHWQLDGYDRKTNPRLSAESNLVNLPNVIAVNSATLTAVPYILTRKPPEDAMKPYFGERSFITAFKEAGFTTYWLSTQAPAGRIDTPLSVYAHEADHVAFFNPSAYDQQGAYDSVMLGPLQHILEKQEDRQLIVLHTMGSHADYAARYPDDFDVFKPSAKPAGSTSLYDYVNRQRQFNSYDNSVLFTDYVLSEIIQRIRKAGATSFLMYSADHGEDLLSPTCMAVGHGNRDRHNLEIPAFAWYSDPYAAHFPNKVSAMKVNAGKPLTEQALFFGMLDAAGISIDHFDTSRSILSPDFQVHPRLVATSSMIDYDKARFVGGCEMLDEPK